MQSLSSMWGFLPILLKDVTVVATPYWARPGWTHACLQIIWVCLLKHPEHYNRHHWSLIAGLFTAISPPTVVTLHFRRCTGGRKTRECHRESMSIIVYLASTPFIPSLHPSPPLWCAGGHFEGILGLGRPVVKTEKTESESHDGKPKIKVPSFLETAGVRRFSMCFNHNADGTLGLKTVPRENLLTSTGKVHWSLNFHGLSIGELRVDLCSSSKCSVIPDSGTTLFSGPEVQIASIYEALCLSWQRCRQTHTKLRAEMQRLSEEGVEVEGTSERKVGLLESNPDEFLDIVSNLAARSGEGVAFAAEGPGWTSQATGWASYHRVAKCSGIVFVCFCFGTECNMQPMCNHGQLTQLCQDLTRPNSHVMRPKTSTEQHSHLNLIPKVPLQMTLEALQCSLQCLSTIFPQLKSANGLLYFLLLFSSSVHCLRMLTLCLILIRFLSWRSSSAPPDYSALHFIAVWAWKLLNEDLLQKYIPYIIYMFFGTYLLEIDSFFGSKWVPESVSFLKNGCQFQLVTSCKGASVQRLLCVKAFVCKSLSV